MRTKPVVVTAAIIGAAFSISAAQPDNVRLKSKPSDRRPIEGPTYAAWIPPGTYSAIILNSSGDQRRWAVSLKTASTSVPIVVPPGDNIVVTFKDGWTIEPDDEARLISNLVPFDDSSLYNKFGEQPKYVLSAWGITANGPVSFEYRQID
jgi:hypothetical protein